MIDKTTAREIALDYVNRAYPLPDDEVVILDGETVEKDYGWVFFCNSKRFLETNNFDHMLLGNGPVLVDKERGHAIGLSTAEPLEDALKRYEGEQGRKKAPLSVRAR